MTEISLPIPLLNDLQIAQRAIQDDMARDSLLRRLYPHIFIVASSVVKERSMAQDIVQISAMEIIRSIHTYRGEGALEAWAGRITYRIASKQQYRTHRFTKHLSKTHTGEDVLTENAEKEITLRSLYDKLLEKLSYIPPKRRAALILHIVHGYTVTEVATLTDVSPNTVKDRLRTAYKEMRTILNDYPKLVAEILEELT
jgi:RNA polymerase sigma-70 factor, ECF subfamily